jgi:TRAP-type mannitol/chloroaromatic compound transport system substrate-binding protein
MPEDLKNVIKLCCYSEITESLAEFNYRNTIIYKELSEKYKVKFRMLPEDIIKAWVENSELVIRDIASKDGISKKIYESWNRYRENSMNISKYYELGFLKSRKSFSKS